MDGFAKFGTVLIGVLGAPAAYFFTFLIVVFGVFYMFIKLQERLNKREDSLNDRQKLHQDAIESTFLLYQSQLSSYSQELKLAHARIYQLEKETRRLHGLFRLIEIKTGEKFDLTSQEEDEDDQKIS